MIKLPIDDVEMAAKFCAELCRQSIVFETETNGVHFVIILKGF